MVQNKYGVEGSKMGWRQRKRKVMNYTTEMVAITE